MRHLYTARFLRSLKKCDPAVQDDVVRAVALFEKGKNDSLVKLHRLHGKFKAYHAFSANFAYRIIIKMTKDTVYYADVGTHDVYR